MPEMEFKYSRIDLDRPSFRLIRLWAGSHTDIDCELFDAYIDEVEDGGIPYEALSYTWGGMEKAARIRINGMKMSVTESLFTALHYLRPEDGYRILWVDAICIDQGHHKERGHQVQQMGNIYRKAERVIIWLGKGTKDSDFLMDFLKALPLIAATHSACPIVPQDLKAQYCQAFQNLFHRPWFRRVWILQEAANARRALIVCGWKCVSTQVFTAAPFLLGMEPDFHSKAVLDVMPGRLRERSWYNQQPTLRTLLSNFHGSEASDKRDMIYALLGMSSNVCERNNLRPDYEKDLEELIRDTTSILLFPEHSDTSSFHYIDWSWSDFIQYLESLSSAAFSCAIRRRLVTGLERFLDWDNIDVNWKDKAQRTPIGWASARGNLVMVKLLASREDTEVDSKDIDGQTPLWMAAEGGHESVVRTLLKRGGIEVNSKDKDERTPLWIAAERGHEAVVRVLLGSNGIKVNSEDKDERTPLWIAAGQGHGSIVRALLKCDSIEVNSKDEYGTTPLWIASELGHEDVVKVFVESGRIDVNLKNSRERTLLWRAAERGHKSAVRALLKCDNIEVNSKDEYGRTPLQMAAYNNNKDIVRILLESNRIEVNSKDNLGRTPLQIAAYKNNKDIVRILLESNRIEVNSKDNLGRTPLQMAAEMGNEDIVRILLERQGSKLT